MRKITPMILVALMLVSVLSSFDFAELEETEVIEDAGARAGADAEMVAITNPKETVCPSGGTCRNVMKVGDQTEFSAYIQNSGDADITEMAYSVTVYLSDAAGNPGMVAKDATTGADLSWTNNDVICPAQAGCPFQSLGAGDVLGGGKHSMSLGGVPMTWTPAKGLYVVEMIVDADSDDDIGNDAQQIFVSVEDWYDITVDLTWGNGEDTTTGTDPQTWSLTVAAEGSDTFDPREVQIRLQTVGDVDEAIIVGGPLDQTTIDGGTTNIFTAGSSMTVDIEENVSTEPPTITTASRNVLSTWTLNGSLTVDTASTSEAVYGMKASLVDYVQYGQWPSCVTSGTDNETYDNFCEETFAKDAYPSTDSSTIDGSANIYNDIRISQMSIVQGFNADGSGQGTTVVNDLTGGDLNVGASYIHVELEHRGSDPTTLYDWSVDFSVTDSSGATESTDNVTTCDAIEPVRPLYLALGNGQNGEMLQAYACMMVSLQMDGEYTFSATLVNDSKMEDAKPSNNERSLTLNVRNNAPLITSLDLLNDGDLYVGQDDLLSMSVQVFDVDDPSATNLEVEWTHAGSALPGCERANMQITCSVLIMNEYVTNFPVSVTVYDAHGGETSEELMVQIWNDGGSSSTTASGISLIYNMLYWGTAPFSVNATDGAAVTNVELPGYSGMYDSVALFDYSPSTTYSAVDVLSQSMSVSFDKSLGATSLWYVNNNMWTLISDNAADTDDATISEFSYTFPANSPVLTAGQMVLMGGSLAQAEIPTASITGFNAAAGKAGAILLNWNVDGTMLTGDSIDVTICEAVDCTNAHEAGLGAGNTSYTYSGTNTVHGTNYSVSVAVCNEVGCSSPIGAGFVIADSEVDGGAAATDLTIAAEGNTWTVSWTASGDQTDVASWKVCYNRGTFTAGQIDETTCVDATGTSVDIDISTWSAGTYTYHFTAVPVDALGNSVAAGSMNSIDYQRDASNTNDDDGTTVIGDDVESDVPTWTWGVIGGIVVVAFIAGAFILSRGGDGDEGKDWDY